ncbi:hypothetical protein ABB37_07393 [Leptomonas pyrrhocoris]|uniref:Uncharacterized protein n=1 Tax=Leptomonas pyrrhocoris TaxID=157538 RepID=A0A0M9FVQ8_LEPPY|nr:hypothetical protein ABB37_07393 [Leptomonas pyrrhocoris]KPA77055.1 hypothetical protein ABB37_07393 [Leptomonas pyrrhocoris]|eukprot:XP_015655494.1 hypothetical protein ABB37_07393 [Leptomonas pyrrhocoris]
MRGGFGRYRYERPQPGLQIHSYEDALYPPRAYRYHIQQAAAPAVATRGASHLGSGGAEVTTTAIVLPTIDADAACGPFLKSSTSNVATGNASAVSAPSSSSSLGYLGRSTTASASNSAAGIGVHSVEVERRPPPRLRYFFDCFVPDEDGADVQSMVEVCRHAELLNPFHYRELWGGMDGAVAMASATAEATSVIAGTVKAEPEREEEEGGTPLNGRGTDASDALRPPEHAVKHAAKVAKTSTATTRAAQHALQRTLAALGVPAELSSMVLLAARVPPGGRLTRKQEKLLRLRHQRRPAPPRPIRRGAKVFLPAHVLLATSGGGGVGAEVYGLDGVEATGGLIDVTAAGPRVLRVKRAAAAAAHQRGGVFGAVDGGLTGDDHSRGGGRAAAASTLLSGSAFDDDDDEEEKSTMGRGGRRAGGKHGRGGGGDEEEGGVDEGDIPLIASGRWGPLGSAGTAGGNGAGVIAVGQLDEEGEEDSDEEDDLSTGMADDDDDDANFSSDGGDDNDSFGGGGGDDGNDGY